MNILVTGGAGYIGSHTCIELLAAGHDVAVLDNLANSKFEALRRVEELTGKTVTFHQIDLLDREGMEEIFANDQFDAVVHFAGLKAVGESVAIPLLYYQHNITGTINLLQIMEMHGVKRLVFSSSATVYGNQEKMPLLEDFPLSATNPYGRTKLMIEEILRDLYRSDDAWDIGILRYFNPVGAHDSGRIGEDPNGIPNNLFPYITQVAIGKRESLSVFGGDYPTHDGTGIRDYIHVVDLAVGHLQPLEKLMSSPGLVTYNLGTGVGYSVLDVIHAFEKVSGQPVSYRIVERRPGDVATSFSDPQKAAKELGWHADKDIEAMCKDSWRWQSENPNGYETG